MDATPASGRSDREPRARTIAHVFAVLSIAAFSMTISLWSLELLWVPIGDAGLGFSADTIVSVDAGSPGERAGLRVGDRFDPGTPFFVRRGVGGTLPLHLRPVTYSFVVIRNGAARNVTVSIVPRPGDLAYTGLDAVFYVSTVLLFLLATLIGAVVVLVRPSRLTWMLFLFCVGLFPPIGPVVVLLNLPMPLGFILNLVRSSLVCIGLFAFTDFALRFPGIKARGWRKPVANVLPVLAIGYWVWGGPFGWMGELYPAPMMKPAFLDPTLDLFVWLALLIVSIASLAGTYRSSDPEDQQRLKWTFLGVGLGFAALLCRLAVLATGLDAIVGWLLWTAMFGAFLAPVAVAYAVLKGRVLDVRFVVNRLAVYLIVSSPLAMSLAATYWITSLVLQHSQIATIAQLIIAIALGMAFLHAYRQLDSGINRLFFKRRYEAQKQMQHLAGSLSRVDSIQELETLVTIEPVIALDLSCGALYRRSLNHDYTRETHSQGESFPTQLGVEEPLIVRLRTAHGALRISPSLLRKIGSGLKGQASALALPVFVDDALYAVVMFGTHANGSDLDPKERAAIEALQVPAERAYAKLLRQAEQLRELSVLLANSPNDASDDLHSYLASQMIDAIPARTLSALIACAAIPGASSEEVVCASENLQGAELLHEFAGRSAVVRQREDGTFAVHDLIARVANARFPDRGRQMLVRCAQRASQLEDWRRAAQLFRIAGLQSAFAQELEKSLAGGDSVLRVRTSEDVDDVATLDFDLVKHRPYLCIQRGEMRLFQDAMHAAAKEAQFVYNTSYREGSLPDPLVSWCAYLHAETGDLASAAALLEEPHSEDVKPFAAEFRATTTSLVAGRLGRLSECKGKLDAASGLLSRECRGLKALIHASLVERVMGRWNQERGELDSAIDTLKSGNSRFLVWALAEGVVGAWLAGQERARLSYLKRLTAAIAQFDAPTFANFAAASQGERCDPTGMESPRWLAWSHLARTCSAASWHEAIGSAGQALDAAVDSGEPFLQLLARIACAELDEANRCEHQRHALELSKAIDSSVLAVSVRSYIANEEDAGMLERLVMRLRQDRNNDDATLTIELAGGRIRRGAQPVALSERELAVALALARTPKSTSSMELSELIWPDLDESAGAHAVQTCMHRLRQRLGDPRAIENTAQGYRLRDDIVVDLFEVETLVRGMRTDEELDELTALRLAAAAKHLDGKRPAFMTRWEWFAPIERRIEEWSRMAKYRLAEDALQRKSYDRAVQFAQQLIARDELDEPAWEIALRALVEGGDRGAAQRELRRYREITLRELNAEPSKHLSELLEAPLPGRALRLVGN